MCHGHNLAICSEDARQLVRRDVGLAAAVDIPVEDPTIYDILHFSLASCGLEGDAACNHHLLTQGVLQRIDYPGVWEHEVEAVLGVFFVLIGRGALQDVAEQQVISEGRVGLEAVLVRHDDR